MPRSKFSKPFTNTHGQRVMKVSVQYAVTAADLTMALLDSEYDYEDGTTGEYDFSSLTRDKAQQLLVDCLQSRGSEGMQMIQHEAPYDLAAEKIEELFPELESSHLTAVRDETVWDDMNHDVHLMKAGTHPKLRVRVERTGASDGSWRVCVVANEEDGGNGKTFQTKSTWKRLSTAKSKAEHIAWSQAWVEQTGLEFHRPITAEQDAEMATIREKLQKLL